MPVVAYVHSTDFTPIEVIVYMVIIGIVAVIGVIARNSRRKNMSRYGHPP